ncbi:HD domain-containing protein [Candidatus Woesebacteria bacterium]|nr:MAG: HD domain-containing protein [Candidatus Woesebacteria bacterium]
MEINIPDEVKNVLEVTKNAGYEIYIVGGSVRDAIMKKDTNDWDFTTNATPQDIQNLFPDSFYDNVFGTVGISYKDNEKPLEITTFRTEHGYTDSRRPDTVTWGKTLLEDVKRRDFTINALALKHVKGNNFEVIDYFSGHDDLENKIIKAVGDANERFAEDALRMMRAIRIASELNFKIESATKNAIYANKSRIHNIAKERVRDEFLKLISSPHAYNGMLLFKEVGLLEEILPELEKCFGVEQKSPGRHHIYDVGTHLLMSLKYCPSNNPIVRFATLIHDIGKAQTYKKLDSGVITFYNHEVLGAKMAKNISDRLRLSNKDKDILWKLVRFHQFSVNENQTDKAIRRFIVNVGLSNVNNMLDLRTADRLGGGATETSWRTEEFKKRIVEVQKQPFAIRDIKISGNDIMEILKIQPGPKVGLILQELFEKVVNKELENERDALIKEISKYLK